MSKSAVKIIILLAQLVLTEIAAMPKILRIGFFSPFFLCGEGLLEFYRGNFYHSVNMS